MAEKQDLIDAIEDCLHAVTTWEDWCSTHSCYLAICRVQKNPNILEKMDVMQLSSFLGLLDDEIVIWDHWDITPETREVLENAAFEIQDIDEVVCNISLQ